MRTLIFEPCLTGHHLEYLNHYYKGALERPEQEYIFLVPFSFENVRDKYEWKFAKNIRFEYFEDRELSKCIHTNKYVAGYNKAKLISKSSKLYGADRVLLTILMEVIPFVLFFLPSGIKLRGIIYQIYLYTQSSDSKFRVLIDKFRYWLMARCNKMEKVYILNDEDSANKFNCIFKTNKFTFLPDPVPNVDMNFVKSIRSDLGLNKNDFVYFHFGGLAKRKGTLEILKAIIDSKKESLNDCAFIFAGKVNKDIKDEFYSLLSDAREKARVLVYDEFCSYEFLYNLCYSIDCILMPYKITKLSSGVLGYAAVFKKPVIGPSDGLIGNLIKRNGLGMCLPYVSKDYIKKEFGKRLQLVETKYVEKNDVSEFIRIILK